MMASHEDELREHGEVQGMVFMPVRRTTYPSQLSQGLQGRIRHHGEDGEVRQDIIVDRETDLNQALLDADLDEAREGTPVFSIPYFDDRDIFSMAIGLAFQTLGDVKFICFIAETWTSSNHEKYRAPSLDPERSEALLGWCLVFDESNKILGYYHKMSPFTKGKGGIEIDSKDIEFEDDLDKIMEQPMVNRIISRIV